MEFAEEAGCAPAEVCRPDGARFVRGAGFQRLTPLATRLRFFEASETGWKAGPTHGTDRLESRSHNGKPIPQRKAGFMWPGGAGVARSVSGHRSAMPSQMRRNAANQAGDSCLAGAAESSVSLIHVRNEVYPPP